MTDLPTPTATRLRKPSWRDSRLIVGVLLVLVSVVGGALVVRAADERVPVYAAKRQLVPGQALGADDLVRVDAQLGDAGEHYVSASSAPPRDSYVLRELRPGELVPRSAIGAPDVAQTQPVVLQVDATSASVLVAGAVVDVYVNAKVTGEEDTPGEARFAGPQLTLESVAVSNVAQDDGLLAAGAGTRAVQVMVPRDKVRQLIDDVDLGAKITLVPTPGSIRQAGT